MNKYLIIMFLLVLSCTNLVSQIIKGVVKDAETEIILSGATVRIEGTAYGAISDKNGRFSINITTKLSQLTLITSMIGYETQKTIITTQNLDSEPIIRLKSQPLQTGEVVVSANKRVQAVQEVPISMSVIDRRQLDARGAISLERALEYVPGLEINQDNVSIRGTSGFSFGIGSRAALLLDGFPLLAGDNGDMKFDALPMFNIDRIEVVKGAGSALYGSGALGGVVNLITEQPRDKADIRLRAFTGLYTQPRHEQWKFSDDFHYRSGLNASYSQKIGKLGVLISGAYYNDMGYRFYDDRYITNFFGKINYDVTPRTSLSLLINGSLDDKADWVYWNSLDSATRPPTGTDTQIRIKSDKFSGFAVMNHIFNTKLFVTARTGFYLTEYNNRLPKTDIEHRQSQALTFNSEIQTNYNINELTALTFGVNSANTLVESVTYGNQGQNIYAVYIQAEYKVVPEIITTIGVRGDYEDYHDKSGSGKVSDGLFVVSPKFGIAYTYSNELHFRASAGGGFRAPAVAERFSSVAFQGFEVLPNPELKSERSWSYEIGANYKFDIANSPIYADFALFQNDLYDLIEPSFVNPNQAIIKFMNVTRARIRGAEIGLKSFVAGLFGLETSYMFMDPRNLSDNSVLYYRSEQIWYNRLLIPMGDFEIQADYRYKSRVKNIDVQLGLLVKDSDARVDMHVVDARLIYDLKSLIGHNFKFTLNVNNVFDYYYTSMVGNLGMTRMFSLMLEAAF